MRRRKWLFFLFAPFAIAAFIFIGGEIVMHLWNWLTPALFGFRLITFWQALGLLILCRILFGGWSHGSGSRTQVRGNFRQRMQERWESRFADRWAEMTPEERERFRQRFGDRCGPFESPSPKSTA